jgi:hypothetical protein
MTVSEYEERFRVPPPSLHQAFVDMHGSKPTRRRRRRLWIAAALLGLMTATIETASHCMAATIAAATLTLGMGAAQAQLVATQDAASLLADERTPGAVIWSRGRSLKTGGSLDLTPEYIGAFRATLKLARAATRYAKGRAALLREAGFMAVLPTLSVFGV